MKVVLAEFDKGLMLKRNGKIVSRNCPKNILEKILRADGQFPKISWEKILRADGQFPKISWKRF